jgi:hypothetical protein
VVVWPPIVFPLAVRRVHEAKADATDCSYRTLFDMTEMEVRSGLNVIYGQCVMRFAVNKRADVDVNFDLRRDAWGRPDPAGHCDGMIVADDRDDSERSIIFREARTRDVACNVFLVGNPSLSYAGIAATPGQWAYAFRASVKVVAHELGHAMANLPDSYTDCGSLMYAYVASTNTLLTYREWTTLRREARIRIREMGGTP